MKNIKISLLLVLAVFFQKTAFTQNFEDSEVKVEFGTPFPELKGQAKMYQKSNEHIVTVKFDKEVPIVNIQCFDLKSLNFLGELKEYNLGGNSVVEGFNELKGRFYLFFSRYDKKMKVEQLFMREINPSSATFKGEEKLLFEVDVKIRKSVEKTRCFTNFVWGKFGFVESPNDDKFLIYYSLEPEIENKIKENDVVGIHVFNSQLVPSWNNTFDLPYNENSFDLLGFNIRSTGEVCFLARTYAVELRRNSDRNLDHYIIREERELMVSNSLLYIVEKNQKTLKQIKFDFYFNSLIFNDNGGEKVNLTGCRYGHLYNYVISKNGICDLEYKHKIPEEILNQNSTPRVLGKYEKENGNEYKLGPLKSLKTSEVIEQEDGSKIVIAEERYLTMDTWGQNNSHILLRDFYGYIFVMKVSSEGELMWSKKIPKHQYGGFFLDALSYSYLMNKNVHYFFYLDNIENLGIGKNEVPLKSKRDYVVTKFDDNDKHTFKIFLFDINKINSIPIDNFQTRRIVKVSESEMLVEVYKKKGEDVWIRLKLY